MSERRMFSKYYAPPGPGPGEVDLVFNTARRCHPINQPIKVRMMLPMPLQCDTCRNYIYQGTKVYGEMDMGIQIFRFYFKCPRCSAEITLKTDPKNSDYTVEYGATRCVEPWCEEDEINGSSELVLNPTDVLTKTNGPESATKEVNKHSTLSTTVNPCKKQKTEPTAGFRRLRRTSCSAKQYNNDKVTMKTALLEITSATNKCCMYHDCSGEALQKSLC